MLWDGQMSQMDLFGGCVNLSSFHTCGEPPKKCTRNSPSILDGLPARSRRDENIHDDSFAKSKG